VKEIVVERPSERYGNAGAGAREEFAALASITGGTETVLTALRLEVSTLPI
jgi:hypothetical protein